MRTCLTLSRDLLLGCLSVRWELRFKSYVRSFHPWAHAVPVAVPLPPRTTILEVCLNQDLFRFGADSEVADVFRQGLLAQANKAYIMDPRSGVPFAGSASPSPASLLFDPLPSSREPAWLSCCFCSKEHGDYVWANGALLWVHRCCWPLIFGLPPLPETSGSFWFTLPPEDPSLFLSPNVQTRLHVQELSEAEAGP